MNNKQWQSPFNPFNSWKVMFHSDNLWNIHDWINRKTDSLGPPISVTIDPTNRCNQKCIWCLYKGWKDDPNNQRDIPINKFKELVDHLKNWGVKSICLAGGGEPTMYPYVLELIDYIGISGFDLGFITNGVKLTKDICSSLVKHANFVGFSTVENSWENT